MSQRLIAPLKHDQAQNVSDRSDYCIYEYRSSLENALNRGWENVFPYGFLYFFFCVVP